MQQPHLDSPILLIGGHATPAAAVAEELLARTQPVVWVGPGQINQSGSTGPEAEICLQLGIPYVSLWLPKLDTTRTFSLGSYLFHAPASLVKVSRILKLIRPRAVISFGGYMSVPFVYVARALGIPVMSHEQTTVMGRANRINQVVSKSLTSWPDTKGASKAAVLVGNPIRSAFLKKPRKRFNQVFITGGNQGSVAINNAIFASLACLVREFDSIIHQTGELHLSQALKFQSKLPTQLRDRYRPKAFLGPEAFFEAMTSSRLVIGRAGANTVTELLITKTQSILVPLPIAALNEQYHNATLLKKLGLATVVPQQHLLQVLSNPIKLSPSLDHDTIDKLSTLHRRAAKSIADLL